METKSCEGRVPLNGVLLMAFAVLFPVLAVWAAASESADIKKGQEHQAAVADEKPAASKTPEVVKNPEAEPEPKAEKADEKETEKERTPVKLGDTKISAERMEYNYAESVVVMTDKVVVADPQFHLTSDKLFIFFEGTNSLNQIVVMGHVAVSNENRRAFCDKAIYTRDEGKLVMEGNAKLNQVQDDGKVFSVDGDRITIWVDQQRMEVYPNPEIVIPAGSLNSESKSLFQ